MNSTNQASFECRRSLSAVTLLALPLLTLFTVGCGSPAPNNQQATAPKQDPVADFEWGIERLERALRVFRPSSSDGLNVTDRKLDYELIPPSDENQPYSAQVTITTEASFLHAKRQTRKDDKSMTQKKEEPNPLDPLEPDEDSIEIIDIPGTGPQAPTVAATRIEPRVRETKTVFELEYVDGRWKLAKEPERKHEQLWFEYAFE